jgi:hypothetical protein
MFWPMRSGVFREDQGFDVIVNGVARTFLYVEAVAYESALFHKQRHPAEVVEVRVRATGQRIVMREDGRIG